jgi:aminopeptidase N
LSLNRGFSAPVKLTANSTADDQLFLMGHDSDSFNRWEAGQTLGRALILGAYDGPVPAAEAARYARALQAIVADRSADDAFKALMLGLPTESDIAAAIGHDVDTDRVRVARDRLRSEIGRLLDHDLRAILAETAETGPFRPDPASTARRALRHAALSLMLFGSPQRGLETAMAELARPHSMSAEIGALSALVQVESGERQTALDQFHARHGHDHLLIDKWLMLNAQCVGADAAARVEALTAHPDFKWATPNKVYALIAGFTAGNPSGFNAADGRGYQVVADAILKLDAINPQVAARIATGFRSCKVLNAARKAAAEAQLNRILAQPGLSRDVYEIVSRIVTG